MSSIHPAPRRTRPPRPSLAPPAIQHIVIIGNGHHALNNYFGKFPDVAGDAASRPYGLLRSTAR